MSLLVVVVFIGFIVTAVVFVVFLGRLLFQRTCGISPYKGRIIVDGRAGEDDAAAIIVRPAVEGGMAARRRCRLPSLSGRGRCQLDELNV